MSDGKVVIQVTADPSDYDKAISDLGSSTQKSLSTAIKGSFTGNLFAQAFSKAAGVIANSMDSAISRVDTMKNFPRVMQSLGYSVDDASASIQKMSDHLTGLPTRLDSMTSSVQKIVPTVKDVGKATDIMLSFNDALLAGGASTQVQEAALEQFSQALAKGKPELEDWRSIQTAMPGQLDQVAQSMLGQGKSANDLYEALKHGDVTMNDFCDALVRLDKEGGNGFASFSEQAKLGTQGIATSFSNLENSVVKGLASILDAVGSENIVGVMEGANKDITGLFKSVAAGVSSAMPTVKQMGATLLQMAPQIAAALAGFYGFKSVGGYVANASARLAQLGEGASAAAKASAVLGKSFNPVTVAIAVAAAAVGLAAGAVTDYVTKTENAKKATEGLNQATADTVGLQTYSGTLGDVAQKAEDAHVSVDDLNASTAQHVDAMNRNTQAAQSQISELTAAQGIITSLAGQTDLSAESQGRLEWALKTVNDQFGLSISAADVAANKYKDQDGSVKSLKDSINDLIEAKKRDAQMDAMQANYSEVLKQKTDAESAYADAVVHRSDRIKEAEDQLAAKFADTTSAEDRHRMATQQVDDEIAGLKGNVDNASKSLDDISAAMGDSAKSASESADAFDQWGNSLDGTFTQILQKNLGANGLGQLKDDLRDLGVSVDDLGKLTGDQLQEMALAYDGTSASIVGKLSEWGVGMDEAKAKTAQGAAEIADALNGMNLKGTFAAVNVDISDFSQKLQEAGVSTEQLSSIGSENLSALASACEGNVDLMVAAVGNWNATPLVDKDGNVNVTDASLVDAQGNVYTWNGTALVDKNGNAAVDSTSVVDGTGNVWTWDGTALVSKNANATVSGNAVTGDAKKNADNTNAAVQNLRDKNISAQVNGNAADGSAARSIWDTVRAIGNLVGKTITNTVNNVVHTVTGNAKGGFRPHASGGFVPRYHANGGIATKAVPLDIVGEDGAEAIVPLTNERYAKPFAQIIAREVNALSDMDEQFDRARAQQSMESATQYALLGEAFMRGVSEVTVRLDGVNQRLDRIERKMDREVSVRIDSREFGRLVRGVQ